MRAARTRKREQGATTVEAGLVALLVFTLIFAVIQGALLARSFLTAGHAAQAGAHAGEIAGVNTAADHAVLEAASKALTAVPKSSVERIVVYKASGPETPVPPACLTGSQTGMCNVYTAADFSRPASDFTSGFSGASAWSASSRKVSRNNGTDYLGVYVELHTNRDVLNAWIPLTVKRTTIVRLESSTA